MTNVVEKSDKKPLQEAAVSRRFPSTFEMFDRLFDEDLPSLWSRKLMPFRDLMQFESKMPIVDVIDREGEILVRAELPGVEKKDLDVTMTDHSITINGEKSRVEEDTSDDYYRKEIIEGKFSRTIALPADAGAEVVSAKFKNGVLELVIKKSAEAKRRHIKIE